MCVKIKSTVFGKESQKSRQTVLENFQIKPKKPKKLQKAIPVFKHLIFAFNGVITFPGLSKEKEIHKKN